MKTIIETLVPKGTLALVSTPDQPSPRLYFLSMLYSEPSPGDVQFTVRLQTSVPLNELGEQNLTLLIHGDKLKPRSISLVQPIGHLSIDNCTKLAQAGAPKFKTLILSLKDQNQCAVEYGLHVCGKSGLYTSCAELVAVAHAQTIHVLFDIRWLDRHSGIFDRVQKHVLQLGAVPTNPRSPLGRVQTASSEILRYVAETTLPSIEIDEAAPPPYHQLKRRRSGESFTTDVKRQPASTPATEKLYTLEVDTLRDMVLKTVKESLPSVMDELVFARLLKDLVDDAVRTVLPDLFKELLPRAVARYVSLSRVRDIARRYASPAPPRIVILPDAGDREMHAHIQTLVEKYVAQASTSIEDDAAQEKFRIITEMEEEVENQKYEVRSSAENCFDELRTDCEVLMEKLRDQAKAIMEDVEDDMLIRVYEAGDQGRIRWLEDTKARNKEMGGAATKDEETEDEETEDEETANNVSTWSAGSTLKNASRPEAFVPVPAPRASSMP